MKILKTDNFLKISQKIYNPDLEDEDQLENYDFSRENENTDFTEENKGLPEITPEDIGKQVPMADDEEEKDEEDGDDLEATDDAALINSLKSTS